MHCLQLQSNLKVNETNHTISSDEQISTLFLHPSTITNLSIAYGSCVLAKSSKGCIILKVRSHVAVKTQYAVFSSPIYEYYKDSTISVFPLQSKTEAAKEVYLCPEKFKNFMLSSDFKSYVTKITRDIYVREGLVLNINYLGYTCHFTVNKIIPNVVDNISTETLKTSVALQSTPKANSANRINLDFEAVETSTPISSRSKDRTKTLKSQNDDEHLSNEKFYFLHSQTKVVIRQSELEMQDGSLKEVLGLDDVVAFIKSSIASILPSENALMNVFPRGILLIGPSGSGKSMIGKALKSECSIPAFILECQDINSLENKDSTLFKKTFEEALSCSASILFFDNFDAMFENDNKLAKDEEFIRNSISLIYKTLNYASNVLLIASAKDVNLIPPYLRKNGFFQKELSTNISHLGRKQIFLETLKGYKCELSKVEINEIVDDTNGFTGGQLKQLCRKAKESSQGEDVDFTFKDLKKSVKLMKPVVSFNFEVPNVKWSDIGGMKEVKEALTETIDWPLRLSHQFERFRIEPSKGILMYGPPGCCKTMIAKAVVTEGHFNFIPVKASELFNKYVGESEKTVSELFKKARASAPCVLFFDEIDSLTSTRNSTTGSSNVSERILTQLLTEIDGIEPLKGVCILAATNRPDIVDPSFLRPGRFDHKIYVPLPDAETRLEIFNVKFRNMPTSEDINTSHLVTATEGYSGAEITEICQIAARYAITEDAAFVSMKHFAEALKEVLPKTSSEMKEFFKKYEKQRNSHN